MNTITNHLNESTKTLPEGQIWRSATVGGKKIWVIINKDTHEIVGGAKGYTGKYLTKNFEIVNTKEEYESANASSKSNLPENQKWEYVLDNGSKSWVIIDKTTYEVVGGKSGYKGKYVLNHKAMEKVEFDKAMKLQKARTTSRGVDYSNVIWNNGWYVRRSNGRMKEWDEGFDDESEYSRHIRMSRARHNGYDD